MKPSPRSEIPKPPPMRALLNYQWVNEYELVDWYTDAGKLYPRTVKKGNWFTDLFKKDWQKKLEESLEKNELMRRLAVMDELTRQAQELEMGYNFTTLDADVASEMLDNPKAPNDKLMELLEGK